MEVQTTMAVTNKDAESMSLSRVTSLSSCSSSEGKFVIVTPKRDFWIYIEGSEIVRPVQESGEPASTELVICPEKVLSPN